MSGTGFRRLTLGDIALMHRWLNTDFVIEWWDQRGHSYDEVEAKYQAYITGTKPSQPYLMLYDDKPIGYIQTYRIMDWPEYAEVVQVGEGGAGIDLFIGEAGYIHRGLGPQILRAFLREIVLKDPSWATFCIVGPEPKNQGAIRAYERAGFRYLKTVQVPDEAEPEYLMIVTSADLA